MTDIDQSSEGDSERGFFRIDDELRMNWIKLDPDIPRSPTDREDELRDLNLELHNLISTAFGDSAVLGEALGLLNRKIELLTGNEDGPTLDFKPVPVNLSGSGLAFACDEPLHPEELIEVTMLLLPANTIVRVQTRIIRTTAYPDDDWTYWVRAKYEPRQEVVTEQIVQHVSLRQMQNLAARRDSTGGVDEGGTGES
ncbi:MAG: PilZ domain-containing protein [Luminiphilus sp.]|nr:PilZ domain-containing protein [Luminiphilus sp.]